MTPYDYLSICIGVTFSIFVLFELANNKPRYSIYRVIIGNIRIGRRGRFVASFFGCFILKYISSYALMQLVILNNTILTFNQNTRHCIIPFFLPLLPATFYLIFANNITPKALEPKPDSLSTPAQLFRYLNELTINFWNASIRKANRWYSKKIIDDENTEEIINLMFEKKKLIIALKEKKNRPLFPVGKTSKTHYLMNHYKFDDFLLYIRDKDYKTFLSYEFAYKNKRWDAQERRNNKEYSDERRRIGDYKHIDSAVREGLKFD